MEKIGKLWWMTISRGMYVSKKIDPKLNKESVTKIQCEVEVISILYGYSRNCRQWRRLKKRFQLQRNMSVAYGIASERRYGIYRVVRGFILNSSRIHVNCQKPASLITTIDELERAHPTVSKSLFFSLSLPPLSPLPSSFLRLSLFVTLFPFSSRWFLNCHRHRRRRRWFARQIARIRIVCRAKVASSFKSIASSSIHAESHHVSR